MVDLEYLRKFHTHIGPFVVLGYRIGELARKKFPGDSRLRCAMEIETSPPVSCMIDGIQASTGCTLGRGLIEINEKNGNARKIKFLSKDKSLIFRIRGEPLESILKMLKENKLKESVDFVKDGNLENFVVISNEKD